MLKNMPVYAIVCYEHNSISKYEISKYEIITLSKRCLSPPEINGSFNNLEFCWYYQSQ